MSAISRRGRRASARLLAAALAAVAVALTAPATSLAHAVLVHTSPHRDASVLSVPSQVEFDFNEPVEVAFGALRVYDSDGRRVDRGEVTHPFGRSSSVAVALRAGLGQGIYTATYHVVSADGHPVSGGFSFAVGEQLPAGGAGVPDVADLLARTEAGPVVEGVYGVVRAVHDGMLLLLVGAVCFGLLVLPAGGAGWPRRLLGGAAAAGLVAAAAAIPLQGALAAGVPLRGSLDVEVLQGVLGTRTGETWLARACAWGIALALLLALRRRSARLQAAALGLPAAVLAGAVLYGGHADTQSPRGLLLAAGLVHVLGAGGWLGGLVLLLAAFWRGREDTGEAAAATARFSRLALPAVAALALAGAAQGWLYLGSPRELGSGAYGLLVLAKMLLLGGVVALAALNRRRVGRLATDRAARRLVRRAMRGEVALALAALAATAALVRVAPPAALAAGPVTRDLDVGPLRLELVIEPARVGANDLHLYFFDRHTGAQVDRVKEVTVRLTQPDKEIGPIRLEIPRKGPAHYELLGQALGVGGRWHADVEVRVSAFDEFTARTDFRVS